MTTRDLIHIPLPHGRTGNTGHVSCFLSPRLLADGTLKDFPEWTSWPASLAMLTFRAFVNGTGPYVPTRVGVTADPVVWGSVFGASGNMPVKRWRFVDRSATSLRSFDEAGLVDALGTAYGSVAAAHTTAPPTPAELLANPAVAPLVGAGGTTQLVTDAVTYTEPTQDPPDPLVAEPPEFHEALVMLGAHPELLRLLGIVVDFDVPLPPLAPVTTIRIESDFDTVFTKPGHTARQVIAQMNVSNDFWPLGNPDPDLHEQTSGFVELGSGEWLLSTVDSLVAARQVSSMAASVTGAAGESGALPALHETGVNLLRRNNAAALVQAWQRRADVEADVRRALAGLVPGLTLYAEDVHIGHRIDVYDDVSATWRSPFQRVTDGYQFTRTGQTHAPQADTGWTTFVLAGEGSEQYTDPDPPDQEDLLGGPLIPQAERRLRDAVFLWSGWSAIAAPPGQILDADGFPIPVPPVTYDPASEVGVEVAYDVAPGTLPRLRFGRTYTMRSRAVDLSGGSPDVSAATPASAASPSAVFGRLSPVRPPSTVREVARPTPGVGDFVTTIVLRSDYDISAANVAPQARLLMPPSLAQSGCELHGEPNGGISPADYTLLATRDAASLEGQCLTDAGSGELLADPAGGTNPEAIYLPDPTAAGASLLGLPGAADAAVPTLVPWAGTWPALYGTRLLCREGRSAPATTIGRRGNRLTVRVPKAADLVIELSSSLRSTYVEHFGIYRGLAPATRSALRQLILDGRHWMFTPTTSLRIVHAVRRPLQAPQVSTLVTSRPAPGSTDVVSNGAVTIDGASTERVRLTAVYEDPVDDPGAAAPGTEARSVVLGDVYPPAADSYPGLTPAAATATDLLSTFPDSKRHDLAVTTEAFSRFSSYFTEQLDTTLPTTGAVTLHAAGVVETSVVVIGGDGTSYVRETDFAVDAAAGTIARVAAGAIPAGAPVEIRYVPLPTSRVSTERGRAPFATIVPASQPPMPVRVRELVPAVRSSERVAARSIRKDRDGQVVRVRTERGWYTSGPGELLGVVTDNVDPDELSRVGRDPVVSGPPPTGLTPAAFLLSERQVTDVEPGVDVAGHPITFDPDRGLWQSDVQIRGDVGYRPFVELALAAYQPEALAGAHLSPVVQAESVRLGPSRSAILRRSTTGRLTLTVTGVEHDGIPDETNGNALLFNEVTVTLQVPVAGVDDPDLRWRSFGDPIVATRTVLRSGLTRWRAVHDNLDPPPAMRLLVEETEPVMTRTGGTLQVGREVVYVEVFELPAAWLVVP